MILTHTHTHTPFAGSSFIAAQWCENIYLNTEEQFDILHSNDSCYKCSEHNITNVTTFVSVVCVECNTWYQLYQFGNTNGSILRIWTLWWHVNVMNKWNSLTLNSVCRSKYLSLRCLAFRFRHYLCQIQPSICYQRTFIKLNVISFYVENIWLCVWQETWLALLLLSLLPGVRPFYVPGVAPRDFHEGEIVDIKVRFKLIRSTFHRLAGTLWYGCLLVATSALNHKGAVSNQANVLLTNIEVR